MKRSISIENSVPILPHRLIAFGRYGVGDCDGGAAVADLKLL